MAARCDVLLGSLSGVFYDPKCSIWKQAHAVLLVGFGSEGRQEYWTIKNR